MMKTLQMNQKADYGNWVPAAMIRRSVQETHFSERWQPNETGL